MNNQVMIEEIDWSRIPTVAELAEARAWMTFQACRGLAYNTLDAYGRNLERYLFFLRQTGVQPWDVKQDQVALYLHDLLAISVTPEKESRLANATIQQHLTTVRLFHEYLLEEERCKRNVFKQGSGFSSRPLIRREHKLPWIPTDEDWCRVLAVAAKEPIRNRLMLAMNYDAGLRREELCSLETGDIDPSRRVIRIRSETTKNRRTRVLPYSAITGELFGLYLQKRRALSMSRGRLFLSESRRNLGQPISIWSWSKVVRAIAKRADANGFSTHTMRHLCLTDLARADWDIHEIATFAGHRNIETTMIYIHLSARDLAAKFTSTMDQVHQRRLELMKELFQ
jgi:site-specific recombinase XerD